ncbi:hypothetical protein V8E51_020025 [Hyaloscypha variabilis]
MEKDYQFYDLPYLENLAFANNPEVGVPALDQYIITPSSSTTDYTLFNLKAIEAWVASNLTP